MPSITQCLRAHHSQQQSWAYPRHEQIMLLRTFLAELKGRRLIMEHKVEHLEMKLFLLG